MHTSISLEPGKVYHLYNRGNNREDLFRDDTDYRRFLGLYFKHVHAMVDTYAYCLMRNHFHLLAKIRDVARFPEDAGSFKTMDATQSFANLFNAYAKMFNGRHQRTGRLFEERFKRIPVDSDAYFSQLVVYIHRNPERHGFVSDFRAWEWSSYRALCSDRPTRVERDEVMRWFGDAGQFVGAHGLTNDEAALEQYVSDDPE